MFKYYANLIRDTYIYLFPVQINFGENDKNFFLFLQHERERRYSTHLWRCCHDILGIIVYMVNTGFQLPKSDDDHFFQTYNIMYFLRIIIIYQGQNKS